MAGLTKEAKLCCEVNVFVEGRDSKYCNDCYYDIIETALTKEIDWDKVVELLRSATEDYIMDTHHCDSPTELMEAENEDVIDAPFEAILERVLGPGWPDDDEKYEPAIDLAHEIRFDLMRNVEARIKIVVE